MSSLGNFPRKQQGRAGEIAEDRPLCYCSAVRRFLGILFVILSAACFGAMPVFARMARQGGADTFTMLFLRFSVAAVIMVALLVVRRVRLPRGKTLAGLAAAGMLGYVGVSLCYFTALTLASASLVALLLYLYPALVAVLSAVVYRERFGRAKLAALLLALTGAALTIGFSGRGQPEGIVLGVVASLIYSVYIVASTHLLRTAPAFPSSVVVISSAAFAYALLMIVRGPSLPATAQGWLGIANLSIVSTVVPVVLFFAGIERIGPTNASILSAVEPAVTVLLAALVLGETVTVLTAAGGLLILAAVVLLARGANREPGSLGSAADHP